MRFETIASHAGNRPDVATGASGIASLAEHPATMSYAPMPEDCRERAGITSELVRLSVDLKNADDLIEDLEQVPDRP